MNMKHNQSYLDHAWLMVQYKLVEISGGVNFS
jgi:hypothetical protein